MSDALTRKAPSLSGAHQVDPTTPGASQSQVSRSNFTDISCSAVQLGAFGDAWAPPERQNRQLVVSDSVVRATPAEFHGCAGIIAGYLRDSTITHNDLRGVMLMLSRFVALLRLANLRSITIPALEHGHRDGLGLGESDRVVR